MDIVTASLIAASLIFDVFVYIFVKYLSIYGEDEYDDRLGGVRLVPVQQPDDHLEANQPLLQPVAVASSTADTAEMLSPPQSPPQSLSPPPEEIRPRTPNRPQSQVVYAEILRTAPTVMAERQARAASPGSSNGSPKTGARFSPGGSPALDQHFPQKSPSSTPRGRESPALDFSPAQPASQNLSPFTDRSMSPSDNSSSSTSASYTLPTERPQRPTGFKDRLMKEPLPKVAVAGANGPITNQVGDLRALSPDTPETNF